MYNKVQANLFSVAPLIHRYMTDIRPFINYLKENNISQTEALELLKNNKVLDNSEKNLIYAYCYPRPLGDYELPSRVKAYRDSRMTGPDGKADDPQEVILLVEACQTDQYRRFMKHLMHAFGNPDKLFPVAGSDEESCSICGKKIYDWDKWKELFPEDQGNHKLCYGSTDREVVLCVDCLKRLVEAIGVMNEIDPGFLDWTKRKSVEEIWRSIRPI